MCVCAFVNCVFCFWLSFLLIFVQYCLLAGLVSNIVVCWVVLQSKVPLEVSNCRAKEPKKVDLIWLENYPHIGD